VEAYPEVKSRESSKVEKEAKMWFHYSPFSKEHDSFLFRKNDEHKFPDVYQKIIQASSVNGQESLWTAARSINNPLVPVTHQRIGRHHVPWRMGNTADGFKIEGPGSREDHL
jgi:hypothetical protein